VSIIRTARGFGGYRRAGCRQSKDATNKFTKSLQQSSCVPAAICEIREEQKEDKQL
jgi:hypothetical protein